jgi:hypothetical protein
MQNIKNTNTYLVDRQANLRKSITPITVMPEELSIYLKWLQACKEKIELTCHVFDAL